jgi:hypothetical protein
VDDMHRLLGEVALGKAVELTVVRRARVMKLAVVPVESTE